MTQVLEPELFTTTDFILGGRCSGGCKAYVCLWFWYGICQGLMAVARRGSNALIYLDEWAGLLFGLGQHS